MIFSQFKPFFFKNRIRLFAAGVVFFFSIGLALWILPERIFEAKVRQAQETLKRKYGVGLFIGSKELKGFNRAELRQMIFRKNGETLGKLARLDVEIRLLPLLWGEVRLAGLTLANGEFKWKSQPADSVLDKNKKVEVKDSTLVPPELQKLAVQFVQYLEKAPQQVHIDQVGFAWFRPTDTLRFFFSPLTLVNHRIQGQIEANGREFLLQGEAFTPKYQLFCSVSQADTAFYPQNALFQKLDVAFGAKYFALGVKNCDAEDGLNMDCTLQGADLRFFSKKVSPDTLTLRSFQTELKFTANSHLFELDSASTVKMNDLQTRLYFRYQNRPDTVVALRLQTAPLQADRLIAAFPRGFFSKIQTMKLKGELSYRLNLFFQSTLPDTSTIFESNLTAQDFAILDEGKTEISAYNHAFQHRPYQSARVLAIDAANPAYIPLSRLSPYVKNSVLLAEDGKFFIHKGFDETGLKVAAAKNIRSGKFKAGGSTITMQWVKNVMLTHKKNIGRKIEEALLVWIIENQRLLSKDRILETYLNLIEWGPEVYGIGEASQFYFNKPQDRLTLEESLYLAMIIPWPRVYMYHFSEKTDSLLDDRKHTFRRVATVMYMNHLLKKEELDSLNHKTVLLKGRATEQLRSRKKFVADSLQKAAMLEEMPPADTLPKPAAPPAEKRRRKP